MAKDAFKFSGQGAINYDQYLGPILFEPYAMDLISRLPVDEKITDVLEIACGTGRVTNHLRHHFKSPIKLVASDFNPDMLQVAISKVNDPLIEFRVEDAQNLSFPDHSFDLVICQFGLMFLQDKKKGLSEAWRVLKPGGKFIFSTWDKTDHTPLLKLVFNDVILPYFKNENTARLLVPFSLHTPSLLKSWMEETDFINVAATQVSLASGSPSAKEIINGFFAKHSLGQEVLSNDPAEFEKMTQKMEELLIKKFGIADLKFELTAFLISGYKPS